MATFKIERIHIQVLIVCSLVFLLAKMAAAIHEVNVTTYSQNITKRSFFALLKGTVQALMNDVRRVSKVSYNLTFQLFMVLQ